MYHSTIWIIGHSGSDKRNNHAYSKKRLMETKNKVVRKQKITSHWQWLGLTGTAAKNTEFSICEIAANGFKTVPGGGTPL